MDSRLVQSRLKNYSLKTETLADSHDIQLVTIFTGKYILVSGYISFFSSLIRAHDSLF